MLEEVDALVEYLKFQRSAGQAVPKVAVYAELRAEYGVLLYRRDFSGCPRCGLKPSSLP
jgi:hypothetical protein